MMYISFRKVIPSRLPRECYSLGTKHSDALDHGGCLVQTSTDVLVFHKVDDIYIQVQSKSG